MDILASQVDGIYLEENYRVPVSCSVATEYTVSSHGFITFLMSDPYHYRTNVHTLEQYLIL